MSPTLNQDSAFGDRQFMVITSEKQCRIVALPSQNCVYRLQIAETDFVVRAEIVSMKGKWLIKMKLLVTLDGASQFLFRSRTVEQAITLDQLLIELQRVSYYRQRVSRLLRFQRSSHGFQFAESSPAYRCRFPSTGRPEVRLSSCLIN